MTKKQVELGISSLFWVILGTSSWMLFIEKHGPFYGYYSTHDFGIKEWIISLVV
jgi:lathosterol oxidase